MEWEQISFSFLFGTLSSIGVCLVSCTPILLAYLISTEKDPRKFIGWFLLFIGIRALVFVALTILVLLLGRLALDFMKEYAFVLHSIGGIFIATVGILIFLNIGGRLKCFRAKSKGFILLAVLFGIKPCLPHIGLLGYILVSVGAPMVEGRIQPTEAIFQTAVIALSFSLGENIVPVILGGLGGKSIRYFHGRGFRIATKAGGIVLFVLGILFIFYDRIAPVIARMFA